LLGFHRQQENLQIIQQISLSSAAVALLRLFISIPYPLSSAAVALLRSLNSFPVFAKPE